MRLIGILIGIGLIVVGVPLIVTPLPVGIVLTGIGVVVLVASSPFVARRLKAWRRASKTVDRALDKAGDLLPDELAEPLERTEPKPQRTADARPVRRMAPGERRRRLGPPAG